MTAHIDLTGDGHGHVADLAVPGPGGDRPGGVATAEHQQQSTLYARCQGDRVASARPEVR